MLKQNTDTNWESYVLQLLRPIAARAGVKWHNVSVHFSPRRIPTETGKFVVRGTAPSFNTSPERGV